MGQRSEGVYLAQAVSDQRKSVELLGVVTVVPAYKRKILSQREMLRHSEDTSLEIRKTLSMKVQSGYTVHYA